MPDGTAIAPLETQTTRVPEIPKQKALEQTPRGEEEKEIRDEIREAKKDQTVDPQDVLQDIAEEVKDVTIDTAGELEKKDQNPANEQRPQTPQEVLQVIPQHIREPIQTWFDTLNVISSKGDIPSATFSLQEGVQELDTLLSQLKTATIDRSKLLPLVTRIATIQAQSTEMATQVQTDAEETKLQAEQGYTTTLSTLEKEVQEAGGDTTQSWETQLKTLKDQLDDEDLAQARSFALFRPLRSITSRGRRDILAKKATLLQSAVEKRREAQHERVTRETERSTSIAIAERVPTEENIVAILDGKAEQSITETAGRLQTAYTTLRQEIGGLVESKPGSEQMVNSLIAENTSEIGSTLEQAIETSNLSETQKRHMKMMVTKKFPRTYNIEQDFKLQSKDNRQLWLSLRENPTLQTGLALAIDAVDRKIAPDALQRLSEPDPSYEDLFAFLQVTGRFRNYPIHSPNFELLGLDTEVQWRSLTPEQQQAYKLPGERNYTETNISGEYTSKVTKNIIKHVVEDSVDADKKQSADQRNRELVAQQKEKQENPLTAGALIHGAPIDAVSAILHGGVRAGEFIGPDYFGATNTIMMCNFSRIGESIVDQTHGDFDSIYKSTFANAFGAPLRDEKAITAREGMTFRDSVTLVFDRSNPNAFLRGVEGEVAARDGHVTIPVGLPSTEISGIIVNTQVQGMVEKVKGDIILNASYIPIYDVDGSLIFTPEEYDGLKQAA